MVGPIRKPPRSTTAKINPFERKPSSLKYNVLGKSKGKAQSKSLAVARSEAFQKRKQSLLVEATQSTKENKFIDRRFAEEQNIPEEDKMLMRFQRERMARVKKGGGFNLDDEDEELVTHGGVALGEIDHFDRRDASDSDEENLGRDTVKDYHFGGFKQVTDSDEPERVKSKREVMQEIIAKSKLHKAEKRREKAEREDMLEQLNEDFKDISSLLEIRIKEKVKSKRGEAKASRQAQEATDSTTGTQDPNDFDVLTRELASEIKARPTDRMKTPDEQAKEVFETLQKAEKARIQRMKGRCIGFMCIIWYINFVAIEEFYTSITQVLLHVVAPW
jgi:nucleolar protein 14